jgi:stage V sporulation protein AC
MRADRAQQQAYRNLVQRRAPRPPVARNALLAFLTGGSICAVGQIFMNFFLRRGLPPEKAGAMTAVAVILLGAALTALGLYDEIVRVAGMGGALPVSGFSNSVVSAAMEFRREGWVLGTGARMFTVAGPVLAFGLLTSIAVGAAYLLLRLPVPQ